VRKTYQNEEIDTSRPAVPETVSVALAELAGDRREGLPALAVGTGLQVLAALMEEDVTAACGPRGEHDPQRRATRHGHGARSSCGSATSPHSPYPSCRHWQGVLSSGKAGALTDCGGRPGSNGGPSRCPS
jgi:hypothetical protein